MKQIAFTFLLGVFVTISIAATSINSELLTIKPATPKFTVAFEMDAGDVDVKINNYAKQGFVVQHVIPSGHTGYNTLVIMVKY